MAEKIRVLYIDDEPDLLELTKLSLEEDGEFFVDSFTSAQEALAAPSILSYDAIVSDYMMPGMTGIAFLKEIRQRSPDIPFILFTGRGREQVVIEALNNGADFYLQKGGEPEAEFAELAHKIRHAVKRRRAETELAENRDYLQRIFSSVKEGIVVVDAKTHEILDLNSAAETLIGRTRDQIVGKVCHLFMCPTEKGKCPITDLHQTMDNAERILLAADGRQVPVIKYVVPFSFHGRDCLLETIFDNSERKKAADELRAALERITIAEEELRQNYQALSAKDRALRESEEKFRGMAERTSDLLIIIDKGLRASYVSPSSLPILGYSSDEVTGRSIEFAIATIFSACLAEFRDIVRRVMAGERVEHAELPVYKKDGTLAYVDMTAIPVMEEGIFSGVQISLRDITERRKAVLALRESEERFRLIVENSPYPIIITSLPEGKFLQVNRAFRETSGFSEAEVLGSDPITLGIIPEAEMLRIVSLREKEGKVENAPLTATVKSGGKIHVLASSIPVTIGGRPVIVTAIADVTKLRLAEQELVKKNEDLHAAYEELTATEEELRQNYAELHAHEQALRESEEKYRLLTEVTGDVIYLIDRNGIVTHVSPQIARYGYAPERVTGRPFAEFIAPEDLPAITAEFQICIATGKTSVTRLRIRGSDGSIHWVESNGAAVTDPSGTVTGISGILRDVSERVQAENVLRESEGKFRALVEHSLEGTLILDPSGRILFANATAKKIIDAENMEIAGVSRNVMEFIDPASLDDVRRDFGRVAGGVDGYLAKYLVVTMTGERRWVESIGKSIVFSNAPAILISLRDVTGRQQAEDALRDSEELFRQLFANANDAITLVENIPTGPGRFLLVNDKFAGLLGYSREELLQMSPADIVPREVMEKVRLEMRKKIFEDGHAIFESMYRTREGLLVPVEVSIHRFMYRGKDVALSHIRDIGERKRSLEALRQANRKLNILSGITRHDIRNKLLALNGFVALLKKGVPDPAFDHHFSRINAASNAIASMIQFTKEYEQIGVRAPGWEEVRSLADRAARDAALDRIELKNDLPPGLEVYADPLIIKVFFNLIDNAVRHGGKITWLRFSLEERDGSRILVCSDDGLGISPDEKERIFDLGYGKNTGFGLALSREILDITGISIRETGVQDTGARFEITVPPGGWRVAEKT